MLRPMKTWFLLSPRAPHELEALADGCNRAVEFFRAERTGEACALAHAGGEVPSPGQIAAAYRAAGLPVTDRLLARLQSCEGAMGMTLCTPAALVRASVRSVRSLSSLKP